MLTFWACPTSSVPSPGWCIWGPSPSTSRSRGSGRCWGAAGTSAFPPPRWNAAAPPWSASGSAEKSHTCVSAFRTKRFPPNGNKRLSNYDSRINHLFDLIESSQLSDFRPILSWQIFMYIFHIYAYKVHIFVSLTCNYCYFLCIFCQCGVDICLWNRTSTQVCYSSCKVLNGCLVLLTKGSISKHWSEILHNRRICWVTNVFIPPRSSSEQPLQPLCFKIIAGQGRTFLKLFLTCDKKDKDGLYAFILYVR